MKDPENTHLEIRGSYVGPFPIINGRTIRPDLLTRMKGLVDIEDEIYPWYHLAPRLEVQTQQVRKILQINYQKF